MNDGVMGREFRTAPGEPGKVYSRLVMSTNIRGAILDRNAELRKNPGVIKDWQHGRLALSIPLLDHERLKVTRPDMFSEDKQTRERALVKFINSPDSAPYKVR